VTNANRLRTFTPKPIPAVTQAPATDPAVEVGHAHDDENTPEEKEKENTMSHNSEKATDPVCGMSVDPAAAASSVEHEGQTYYFCSNHCAESFRADPARYTGAGTP